MKKPSVIILIILAVAIPAILSTWGVTESSEARYAQIGKEMYESGDYLHPSFLGIHHYHKPPLTYYITSLGYAIFGINETGARFFLFLALLLQVWLVYRISLLFYNDRTTALAAMLLYFSYPIVQIASKNLTTDCFLTSFIFASVYCFLYFRKTGKVLFLYLFYFFCGLAFLTKGPVGLMPQALFAICYNRIYPVKQHAGFHRFTALLLGFLICFSWFIVLVIDNPGLLNYFVKYQLVDRVASNTFKRTKPWWYYLLTMPAMALPAFIYFFDYLKNILAKYRFSAKPKPSILIISLSISLLVFSLSSSKLVLYVLPLFLFIAMVSAFQLVNMNEKKRSQFEKISFGFSIVLFSAIIVACFCNLPLNIPKLPVISFSLAGIIISTIVYLQKWFMPVLKGPVLNVSFIVGVTFMLPFIMKANELKINSIKPVAAFIKENSAGKENKGILIYNYLLPSMSFYTNKKVVTLDNGNPATHREIQFEKIAGNWEETYIRIPTASDSSLAVLKEKAGFLLVRNNDDLPDSLVLLRYHLPHRVVMDKWIIYY